jgi:hypothetical protein
MNKFDYEYLRQNNSPVWQHHWLNLLEGRFIISNNELVEDPNAQLFRIGLTVVEVEAAVGHSGYTARQLDWYRSQPERFQLVDGQYVQFAGWQGQHDAHLLATAVEDKRKEIQQEKCRRRDVGLVISGIKFDTDANAQTMYTQYMVVLLMDNSYAIPEWKASDGVFVVMNGALFMQLREAWTTHISAITAQQKAKEIEIDSLTTLAAVEAYDASEGWL